MKKIYLNNKKKRVINFPFRKFGLLFIATTVYLQKEN